MDVVRVALECCGRIVIDNCQYFEATRSGVFGDLLQLTSGTGITSLHR